MRSNQLSYLAIYALYAGSDEQYLAIIQQLLAMNLPSSINIAKQGKNLPLDIGFANMNLQMVEQVSEAELSGADEESLKQAIAGWFSNNYAATNSYKA